MDRQAYKDNVSDEELRDTDEMLNHNGCIVCGGQVFDEVTMLCEYCYEREGK